MPPLHGADDLLGFPPVDENHGDAEAVERAAAELYYTLADMDDVDTRNRAYRKKLIIAVDKNTIDTYSVAAYFVRKTKP